MYEIRLMNEGSLQIPRQSRLRLGYLYGGSVRYQPGDTLGPRLLTDYELILLAEGHAVYEVAETSHKLSPGDFLLARPGFHERYVWDKRDYTRHSYFHLGIEAIPHDWPEPNDWPLIRHRPSRAAAGLFQSVLNRSHRRGAHPSDVPPRLDSHMVEILIELLLDDDPGEEPLEDAERPQAVARALRHMRNILEEDPTQALTLSQLAQQAGVSPKHLCKAFRQSMGHPPMATLRLLRLQLSVALLIRTSLAVKEIAAQCGFPDPLHFSRCFSSTFGRSPRKVRQDLENSIPPPANPLPVDLTPRVHW